MIHGTVFGRIKEARLTMADFLKPRIQRWLIAELPHRSPLQARWVNRISGIKVSKIVSEASGVLQAVRSGNRETGNSQAMESRFGCAKSLPVGGAR